MDREDGAETESESETLTPAQELLRDRLRKPQGLRDFDHCEHANSLAKFTNRMLDNLREHAAVCQERIEALTLRVAHLEARKPPQDLSSDPEWFS